MHLVRYQEIKMVKKINKNFKEGFFLIEVVVVASVITVVLIFLLGSIQGSVDASKRSLERTQASYLLEEGAEAIKGIRDAGWTANIVPLENNSEYYLVWNGSAWSLSTTQDSNITQNPFSRSVVFEPVYRDSDDDIVASNGTLDLKTKKVTVNVSWITPKETKNEKIEFIIADIR